ncbi:ABC transporter permease [Pollutibacter soli]|uniref:ABC transporter permease n=1 Tax=Pollutibacter soli TaxID=3034157 RepID=UPI0030134434
MFKNFLLIAWRNIRKQKSFSFINIFGLAVGLTCFMFIAVYIHNELTYDKYPAQAKNIYRVHLSVAGNGDVAEYPNVDVAVGAGMKAVYPEILNFTRIAPATDFVKYENRQFKEKKLAFVDSGFLRFFSLPLIAGNADEALTQPNTVVLSKSAVKKYFGDEDPIGKALTIGVNKVIYKVTGVMEDIPARSHFHFDALLSMATHQMRQQTWSNLGFYTYLHLQEGTEPRKLQAKFPDLVAKHIVPEIQQDMGVSLAEAQKAVDDFVFTLVPLTKIHLYSNGKFEIEPTGDIKYIYIFSALAVFILLLACVNFTNLSTAKSTTRGKEVGIRKVLGSLKQQLVFQFLSESILFSLFSMLLAYVLIYLLLPYFNQVSNSRIHFNTFFSLQWTFILLSVSLVSGTLAGLYPAFFLSALMPIKVLKGTTIDGNRKKLIRSGLIIFQFFISATLIVATIIVYQQMQFMQDKKLGYDKDQVLFLPDARLLGAKQLAFKQKLSQDPRVIASSISRSVPGGDIMNGTEVYPRNENSNGATIHMNIFNVDYDYIPALGIRMINGRNFSKDFPTDSLSGVVINESAARKLGWTNETALGKKIVRSGQQEFTVIGVASDFNYMSVKQEVAPVMLMLGYNMGGLILKINTTNVQGFLSDLQKNWNEMQPPGPLEYIFLDEKFASLYASEKQTQQIFTAFAVIAIIIACLGLFGLSAFIIEQRTKEIGIRKVLGASVRQVLFLVSKEFMILVGIAFLLAVPVVWWVMNNWLKDFAYRINISFLSFIIAAAVVFFVALLTISFRSVKAGLLNPVKSLRAE